MPTYKDYTLTLDDVDYNTSVYFHNLTFDFGVRPTITADKVRRLLPSHSRWASYAAATSALEAIGHLLYLAPGL